MRKFSLLLIALSIWIVAFADNPTTTPPVNGGSIPIIPRPTIPQPLTLYADIEATYFDGVMVFVFNRDLGVSDIVVTNTTTGESWYESVSGAGIASIMLSGSEGSYEIYIYTDCGDYTGTFII